MERIRAANKRSEDEIKDEAEWVKLATYNAATWTRNHTKTYNEHWQEEGRPGPEEPFPQKDYLLWTFALMELRRIVFWEKSRDMMKDYCGILFQAHPITVLPFSSRISRAQGEKL